MPVLKLNSNRKLRSAVAAVALGLLASFLVLQSENIELAGRLLWQKIDKKNTKTPDELRQGLAIRQFYTKLDTLAYDQLFQLRGPHVKGVVEEGSEQTRVLPSIPEVVIVDIDGNAISNLCNMQDINGGNAPRTDEFASFEKYLDSIVSKRTYPFPRKLHAALVRKLRRAGAVVIGIDLDFSAPSDHGDPDDDPAFARALKECGNVVLIAKYVFSERDKVEIQGQANDFPIPLLRDAARAVAPANVLQDDLDSWIRRFHLSEQPFDPDDLTQKKEYPTFATMIAALYWNDHMESGKKFREIPNAKFDADLVSQIRNRSFGGEPIFFHPEDSQTLQDVSSVNICYAGYPGITTCVNHGYDEVLDPKNSEKLEGWFHDKIVLIGSEYAIEQDLHSTPLTGRPVWLKRSKLANSQNDKLDREIQDAKTGVEGEKRFGVEIHANIIHTLLAAHEPIPHYYRDYDDRRRTALIWMCGLTMAFLTVRLRPLIALLPYLAIVGAISLLIAAAWGKYEFLRPTKIIAATTLAYGLETVYFYAVEERRAKLTRSHFQRYVGPAVMNKVLDTDFKPGSVESRYMTIMFTDVQGFTSLSEKISPEELVHTLNQYLDEMVDILYKYEGTLDKIMGDGIMAYFNAPFTVEHHELKAVKCALEMQARMEAWRKVSEEKGLPPLKVRVGIHAGTVVFGEVGAKKQVGFTVIGDAVNTAARLEPLNKQFGSEILISETVQKQLDSTVVTECVGELEIRGRKEGIRAYSVSARETSETNI